MESRIKLVVTDIDGTLIEDSTNVVYPELFEVMNELREKGVLFVAASGRQYESLNKIFEPVNQDMIFVAENGAHIKCRDTDIAVSGMERSLAEELIQDLRAYKDADILASTNQGCYLETKNQEFIDLIQYGYQNRFTIVEDILKEDIQIIKIALYKKGSIRQLGEQVLIKRWEDRCKACMAGEEWIDFMDSNVDKGNALKTIQEFFKITKEETMAFGDNANDIGMLQASGESYAVETAREEVKKHAKHICPSYAEKGVYQTLKTLL